MHYPFDVQFGLHIQRQVKSLAPTRPWGRERHLSQRGRGWCAPPPAPSPASCTHPSGSPDRESPGPGPRKEVQAMVGEQQERHREKDTKSQRCVGGGGREGGRWQKGRKDRDKMGRQVWQESQSKWEETGKGWLKPSVQAHGCASLRMCNAGHAGMQPCEYTVCKCGGVQVLARV